MNRHALASRFAMLLLLIALPGIAAASSGRCGDCGIVTKVEKITYNKDKGVGGAVLGTIIGGVIGNQFGGGKGKTAMTVAGAATGGYIGHKADKNHPDEQPGLRLEIRMDAGGMKYLEIAGQPRIYKGDRVKVKRDTVTLVE